MLKKFSFVFMFILLIMGLVGAVENNESEAGVKYNSDLLEVFDDDRLSAKLMNNKNFIGLKVIDDETFARVMVVLKDNSGVKVVGNKSEKRVLASNKDKWFEEEVEKLIFILSTEGIKDINTNSVGFSALVSKSGFESLLDENMVKEVIWSQYKPESINSEINYNSLLLLLSILLIIIFIIMLIKWGRKNVKEK